MYDIENQVRLDLNSLMADESVEVSLAGEYDIPLYEAGDKKCNKTIMVLSGGGAMGIAYTGVLQALHDRGDLEHFTEFAGASVGALTISLHVLGYNTQELWEFCSSFDFSKTMKINMFNALDKFGVDDGAKFELMLKKLITAKGYAEDITLKDLYLKTNKSLTMTATCLNSVSVEYLSWETEPDLPLWKAIRMSISIPGLYHPVVHNDKYYIDGGTMDNLPVNIYKDRLDDVLAVTVSANRDNADFKINNIETYFQSVWQCLCEGWRQRSMELVHNMVIEVKLDQGGVVEYGASDEAKQHMYDCGYKAVVDKLGVVLLE